MKLQILLILLLLIFVTAGTALVGQAAFAPAFSPTLAAEPTRTPFPSTTPKFIPTPTADPLPTRVVDRPKPANNGEKPKTLLDKEMPDREVVAETEHFIFYAEDGYFPVDQEWFIAEAEEVYDYVSDRLDGKEVRNKVSFGFMPPDDRVCPVRGLASHIDTPMVLLYADENSSREYVLGVLAHELGHAIPSEGFPGGLPDFQPLTEGLATWASGKYWADYTGVDSLDDTVRQQIADGIYEPIRKNVEFTAIYPWHDDADENCLARRDKVYTQWGSFLGYLIETYGWEKAYDLFRAPRPVAEGDKLIEFPPEYEGVYGKALNQLEFDWLNYLSEQP